MAKAILSQMGSIQKNSLRNAKNTKSFSKKLTKKTSFVWFRTWRRFSKSRLPNFLLIKKTILVRYQN